jgi:hypothetical protein
MASDLIVCEAIDLLTIAGGEVPSLAVQAHLAACEDCAGELREIRAWLVTPLEAEDTALGAPRLDGLPPEAFFSEDLDTGATFVGFLPPETVDVTRLKVKPIPSWQNTPYFLTGSQVRLQCRIDEDAALMIVHCSATGEMLVLRPTRAKPSPVTKAGPPIRFRALVAGPHGARGALRILATQVAAGILPDPIPFDALPSEDALYREARNHAKRSLARTQWCEDILSYIIVEWQRVEQVRNADLATLQHACQQELIDKNDYARVACGEAFHRYVTQQGTFPPPGDPKHMEEIFVTVTHHMIQQCLRTGWSFYHVASEAAPDVVQEIYVRFLQKLQDQAKPVQLTVGPSDGLPQAIPSYPLALWFLKCSTGSVVRQARNRPNRNGGAALGWALKTHRLPDALLSHLQTGVHEHVLTTEVEHALWEGIMTHLAPREMHAQFPVLRTTYGTSSRLSEAKRSLLHRVYGAAMRYGPPELQAELEYVRRVWERHATGDDHHGNHTRRQP